MTLSQSLIFHADGAPYQMEISNYDALVHDWSVEVVCTYRQNNYTVATAEWLHGREEWEFSIVKLDVKDFQASTLYETRLRLSEFMDTLEEFKTALEDLQ